MLFSFPPARRFAGLLATGITAILLASTSHAQPVQLLKDLKPGMVPDDERQMMQLVATSETVYMVSQNYGSSNPFDSTFYLNSTNSLDSEPHTGYNMGRISDYGNAQYSHNYPLFAVKDGKAIFSNAQWEHCYFEYDGVTRKARRLTNEPSYQAPAATWIGAGGRVCFFRRSFHHASSYETGYIDAQSSTGLRVTRLLPFSSENYGPYSEEAQVVADRLVISIFENDHKKVTVWSTDGTYDGTEALLTLDAPGGIQAHSMLSGLGKCFVSIGGNNGEVKLLYATDGTSTGTSIIDSNFNGFLPAGEQELFTESTSTLFWRNDFYDHGIYYTDGVSTGILSVDAEEHYGLRMGTITWLNNMLYIATDSNYGSPTAGPWLVSDGQTTPTVLENDHIPFDAVFAKAETTSGTFLYTGNPAYPQSIYFVEDDIEQATLVAHGVGDYGDRGNLTLFQDKPIYSQHHPATNSDQLWTPNPSDPYQPHRLTRFTEIPADSNPGQYEVASNVVYFRDTNSPNIWSHESYKTDGTASGSDSISLYDPEWLGEVPGGMLFYNSNRDPFTGEVWDHSNVYFYNGTSFDWTRYITPTMGEPPTEPARLFTIGDKCFFGGNYDHVPHLFASDGNLPGYSIISNFWETDLEAPLHPIGVAGNRGLFYARTTNTATITYEIWSTDGTEAGTMKIAESVTPPTVGAAMANGNVVFGGEIDGHGKCLLTSDGTSTGTSVLQGNLQRDLHTFVSTGSRAYFVGYNADNTNRDSIWFTDGYGYGTTSVSFDRGDSHFQLKPSAHGGVYLTRTVSHSVTLTYTNGNLGGARDVISVSPDAAPQMLAEINGYMYIAMTTPELGRELYRTVGHTGGLELVEDFAPGPDSGAVMTDAAVFGNKLIFAANPHDGLTGTELHYIEVLDSNVDDWQIY